MKKAMLFMIALLFSVGANAAPVINISNVGLAPNNSLVGGAVSFNDSANPVASFTTSSTNIGASNNVTVDTDGLYKVEWTFNPEANLIGATINKGEGTLLNIASSFAYTITLLTGNTYFMDIFSGTTSAPTGYQLSVSSVPVPAALWLFAPALLGFFGLRRKSSSQALVAA